MEAKMNVEKAQAVISAEKEKEVAQQVKLQAEVKASQLLAVAEIQKKEAQVQLDKAVLDAKAKIELAKAKQQEIELSGAITEEIQILAGIQKETKIGVAKALAEGFGNATLPKIMNFGNSGGQDGKSGGSSSLDTIMQLMVVKMLGDDEVIPKSLVAPKSVNKKK